MNPTIAKHARTSFDLLRCRTPATATRPWSSKATPATPAARQAFARARGTTCVFLDAPRGAPARVDYFYPHMRSPLCLHATLAVAARAVRAARPGRGAALAVRTAMQGQRLGWRATGGDYFVRLAPQPAPGRTSTRARLAALLGVPGFAPASRAARGLGRQPQAAGRGGRHGHAVRAGARTWPASRAWGKAHGVNGIYAWCRPRRRQPAKAATSTTSIRRWKTARPAWRRAR